jgi:ketosteroid isomerase-like protein
MRNAFREKCILSIILSALIGMSACVQKTDADLIMELVDDVGKLIEKKDLPGILNLLADDYSDFTGRTKGQTEDMVQSYFNQFRGIVIHILHTRIDEIEAQQASIQSDVALSSGAARAFRKLIRVSTDNYRLRIKLIKKEDRWLIRYAEWTYIGLDELFPESLSILKKIFSDEKPE